MVYRFNTKKISDRVELDSTVVRLLEFQKAPDQRAELQPSLGSSLVRTPDGRAVALQARVGRKWRTFKQLRTERTAASTGRYRFTQTVGRVRYVFRALVKSQSGYPYEPGASRKRKLVVRG